MPRRRVWPGFSKCDLSIQQRHIVWFTQIAVGNARDSSLKQALVGLFAGESRGGDVRM